MLRNTLYYALKPIIPRGLQIAIRRGLAQRKRLAHQDIWPIDEMAGHCPQGWSGWPEQKQFALILMHDVETETGHNSCHLLMQIEEDRGFRSLFSFVPERYRVSSELRHEIASRGFEVGVHGLRHDGKLFLSEEKFIEDSVRINEYLQEWQSIGFVSPSMHRRLEWMHHLNIEYAVSTFDTDPFEPEPYGVSTIFPFLVRQGNSHHAYVELPYTLPQDFTLFIILQEKSNDIWKRKLDWIARRGGMALFITHPDYMDFSSVEHSFERYPVKYYADFLDYVESQYGGHYWHVLPREMARFWRETDRGAEMNETIRFREVGHDQAI